ncbi:MAG TPA: response regulator transcription factor [Chloroflexota bacterium]|nr:response regulator transcription factor [Chloroflexota bacterium]
MQPKIRILLAEDHDMVRAGLRLVLDRQPDMTVVAEAADGSDAVSEALRLLPTVAILDVGMPGMDGLDALERIKRRAPRIRVLMMSGLKREEHLLRALRSGASGFLLKEGSATDLVQAVRRVAHGELVVVWPHNTDLVDFALQTGRLDLRPPRHGMLTERERDVLRLVAEGHSNTEIALYLGIGPKTVDTHRMHVMDKLGLHSRADLTHFALAHGYLIVA